MTTTKRCCENCYFDNGGDCANEKWEQAVDQNKPVEDKNGCLFFVPNRPLISIGKHC